MRVLLLHNRYRAPGGEEPTVEDVPRRDDGFRTTMDDVPSVL